MSVGEELIPWLSFRKTNLTGEGANMELFVLPKEGLLKPGIEAEKTRYEK